MKPETLKIFNEIDGLISLAEGELLYSLAVANKSGAIVEIGSYKGKSTVCIASGSREGNNSPVYAIDPHMGTRYHTLDQYGIESTLDIFRKNIAKAKVTDIVIPMVQTSREAGVNWSMPIGMLFMDGSKDENIVENDFKTWLKWVPTGCIVCFHDWQDPGMLKNIFRYVIRPGLFSKPKVVDSLLCITKEDKKISKRENRGLIVLSVILIIPAYLPAPFSRLFYRLYSLGPKLSPAILKTISRTKK